MSISFYAPVTIFVLFWLLHLFKEKLPEVEALLSDKLSLHCPNLRANIAPNLECVVIGKFDKKKKKKRKPHVSDVNFTADPKKKSKSRERKKKKIKEKASNLAKFSKFKKSFCRTERAANKISGQKITDLGDVNEN